MNTMSGIGATLPVACRWCGERHGVRCYSVSAIEYHPDGTVKRVEFVRLAAPGLPAAFPSKSPQTIGDLPAGSSGKLWRTKELPSVTSPLGILGYDMYKGGAF